MDFYKRGTHVNCRILSKNILTISAVFFFALVSKPALAESDDAMSSGEIDEIVDDLGNGSNGSSGSSGSGMNGNGGRTTTASTDSTSTYKDSAPTNDFSSRAAEMDEDQDEDFSVDKEIGESGSQDAMYDHYSGATPEPQVDENKTTAIPSGDSYNRSFVKKQPKKKHAVKKSKKSKHKVVKRSKNAKKKYAKAKSKKKSKDRQIASRKGSSKKRVR